VLISRNNLKQLILENIPPFYDKEEIDPLVQLFMCSFLELSVSKYLIENSFEITDDKFDRLQILLQELKNGKPIEYIFDKSFFFGREFFVTPAVLIPRPETEELCKWIIDDFVQLNPIILDIGCGSGNIPITLKKEIYNSTVYAVDISTEALNVARKNAEINLASVNFELMDILNWEKLNKFSLNKFDIVVSNPPYVLEEEKNKMRDNVLNFEPHLALFVKKDPMTFYETIAHFSKKHLREHGMLYFEINEEYSKECIKIMEFYNFANIELKKDLAGKYRMIKGENIF
jgi:release factor glutamine methyltransferase